MNNKLLEQVFTEMEIIGWNLNDNEYEDFKYTYDYHIQTMTNIAEDDSVEDNITWMCQFMVDFLRCLERIGERNV